MKGSSILFFLSISIITGCASTGLNKSQCDSIRAWSIGPIPIETEQREIQFFWPDFVDDDVGQLTAVMRVKRTDELTRGFFDALGPVTGYRALDELVLPVAECFAQLNDNGFDDIGLAKPSLIRVEYEDRNIEIQWTDKTCPAVAIKEFGCLRLVSTIQ